MAQLLNQFGQSVEKGMLDLQNGTKNNVVSCLVKSTESTALVDAQAVSLVDNANPVPEVTAITSEEDAGNFGFIVKNLKDATHKASTMCEVAIAGTIMFMEASSAIARGAKVSYVVSGQKVKTQASSEKVIGVALDKASTSGDLIRVLVQTPLFAQV